MKEKIKLVISTVDRDPAYIHRTLASLFLSGPEAHDFTPVHLVVGSEDDSYLGDYAHSEAVHVHPLGKDEWRTISEWSPHRRCCHNYHRCLTLPLEGARGLVVCEEDLIFQNDFFPRLIAAIDEIEGKAGLEEYALAAYACYDFRDTREEPNGEFFAPYDVEGFYGSQCVYHSRKIIPKLAELVQAKGVERYVEPLDMIVKECYRESEGLFACRTSLVQHIGGETTGLGGFHQNPTFDKLEMGYFQFRDGPEKLEKFWEWQFLNQDLLPEGEYISTETMCVQKVNGRNILIFSSNDTDSEMVRRAVDELKPRVIVHLSDEFGGMPHYQELAADTALLARQYHHADYPGFDNVLILPLGYMRGMMEPGYLEMKLPPPGERRYIWSFVGSLKQNREEMIETFKGLEPHHLDTGSKMKPPDMRDVYRESIFVPSGRGNFSLDCFRLYEASACGAIPVVAGDPEEIRDTFAGQGDPPWIFASTWEEALTRCRALLEDPAALKKMHGEVLLWWRGRIEYCRSEIRRALTDEEEG